MVKYRISSNRRMRWRLFPSRYSRSSATGPCYAMHVKITSILRCLLSNLQGLHNLENMSNNLFCTIATCKVLLVSNISRCSTPLNSAIIFATHPPASKRGKRLFEGGVYSRKYGSGTRSSQCSATYVQKHANYKLQLQVIL